MATMTDFRMEVFMEISFHSFTCEQSPFRETGFQSVVRRAKAGGEPAIEWDSQHPRGDDRLGW
jgi:hypothetical protein